MENPKRLAYLEDGIWCHKNEIVATTFSIVLNFLISNICTFLKLVTQVYTKWLTLSNSRVLFLWLIPMYWAVVLILKIFVEHLVSVAMTNLLGAHLSFLKHPSVVVTTLLGSCFPYSLWAIIHTSVLVHQQPIFPSHTPAGKMNQQTIHEIIFLFSLSF